MSNITAINSPSTKPGDSEKVKNGCFGAKTDVPTFCTGSAQESFSLEGSCPEFEKACPDIEKAIEKAVRMAEDEEKNRKLHEKLVAVKLTSGDNINMIASFIRMHDDVPAGKAKAVIVAMSRCYAPGKTANAKELGTLAASRVEGVTGRFGRDDVFPLLVNLGLIVKKPQAEGYLWAELQPRSKQVKAALSSAADLCKRAAQPAFPELYDEQRKYNAALKANQLAKQRADLVRQTNALVASTDASALDRRQSNFKVIAAGVAAALFFGGVLVAKYGDDAGSRADVGVDEASAPAFDVKAMLMENDPNFLALPLDEQERRIKEAERLFSEV
jgi:hypothetical protein